MTSEPIKLREYEAFEAFIRLGTVQASATEMDLTQPMVSRLLNNLEQKIGLRLFVNSPNTKVATPEAVLLYDVVARALVAMQQVQDEVVAISNHQKGNIIVAAQPIYCDTFLLDAVAAFKKTHPHVGVRLIDSGMVDLVSMLGDRRCDLGFGITLGGARQEAVMTPLARCDARCLIPTSNPLASKNKISLNMIAREPFVELAVGTPMRTHVDGAMQRIGFGSRHIAAEMRHLRGVCSLVERGVGIAVTDPLATLLLDEKRAVHKPLVQSISWDLALFQPRGRPLSTVAEAFCVEVETQIARLREAGLVT